MECNKISIEKVTKEQAWDIRHIVMYPEKPFDFIVLNGDDTGLHYGLYLEIDNTTKVLVSVISLYLDSTKQDVARFRKFATLVQYQSKGYGTTLLNYMLDQVKSMGIKRLWCNARLMKLPFYNKFGLNRFGESWSENGYDYIGMELLL